MSAGSGAPAPPGAGDAEVRYWRARAEALEDAVHTMRARLFLLAERLPAPFLPLLVDERESAAASAGALSVLEGIEETVALTPADVPGELRRLWKRPSLQGGS